MTYKTIDNCGENNYRRLRDFSLNTNKKNVLFGAWVSGEYISHYLNYCNAAIDFFVDNNSSRIGMLINDIPVRAATDLDPERHSVIVTSERYADEIVRQLLNANFKRADVHVMRQSEIQTTFDSDPAWPDYAITHYSLPFFQKILGEKSIDYSGRTIAHNRYRFINPVTSCNSYRKGFFAAYLDYVLPTLCDDISKVVEGPGEHGNVCVNPGDVVIDCGANIGLFSAIAAAKGALVHAFEPIPECYYLLGNTASLFNGINTWPLAVSNTSGHVRMSFPKEGANTGGSFVLDAGESSLNVDSITIDDFIKSNNINRCDFIKADIEGAERFMLQGAVNTLRQHAPKLSICTYHLPDDPEVLETIIREANPNYIIEHRWQKLYAYVPASIE